MEDSYIKHRHSSPKHPQTNGVVERFNQTLRRATQKSIQDNQTDWNLHVDEVLFGYHIGIQASLMITLISAPLTLTQRSPHTGFWRSPHLSTSSLRRPQQICRGPMTANSATSRSVILPGIAQQENVPQAQTSNSHASRRKKTAHCRELKALQRGVARDVHTAIARLCHD